ncbi:MAG: hypothetical protein KGJ41_11070 [Rhodospirillales bacterium]|nr:hypothetical protein [Rhodospirillales bacterium]MDE2199551.1 hypothetical protein [Rhodospirillales bacterium]
MIARAAGALTLINPPPTSPVPGRVLIHVKTDSARAGYGFGEPKHPWGRRMSEARSGIAGRHGRRTVPA